MEWRPTCVVPLHLVVVAALCKPQLDVGLGVDRMHRRGTRAAGPCGERAPTAAHLAGQPAVTPTCLHIPVAITEWLDKQGDVA